MDPSHADSRTPGYRRGRCLDHCTRREAFEQRFGRRCFEEKKEIDPQSHSTTTNLDGSDVADLKTPPLPVQQLNLLEHQCAGNSSVTPGSQYQSLSDVLGRASHLSPDAASDVDDETTNEHFPMPARPLHETFNSSNQPHHIKYYRIKFKGVANIISQPYIGAPRTGSYLGYGEIFSSLYETTNEQSLGRRLHYTDQEDIHHEERQTDDPARDGLKAPTSMSTNDAEEVHDGDTSRRRVVKFIRVDSVLTGGYATDSHSREASMVDGHDSKTPRRSNTQQCATSINAAGIVSSLSLDADGERTQNNQHYGYLLAQQHGIELVEELNTIPFSESGRFMYMIMSSSPLPVLAGPSFDAPKTKAMLLPGTMHEVSLRLSLDPENEGIFFLRLSHRRGWIADRKLARNSQQTHGAQSVPVVKEIPLQMHTGDASIASLSLGSSVAISSVSATTVASTMARLRHRPPRRQRISAKESAVDVVALPRHIVNHGVGKLSPISTPVKGTKSDDSLIMSPASNVSMMSDDASLHHEPTESLLHAPTHAAVRNPPTTKHSSSSQVRFFLIQVTAPRGLKVLDAPQTQVNSLLHGRQRGNVSSSHAVTTMEGPKVHPSIFQTMSSRLTTTGPSTSSSAAVFDAALKTRILPRGALFEASRRIESSSYGPGAGLIKLADNSGWAIVPRSDELDAQYQLVSGAVGDESESALQRAFAEVGSAVIADSGAAGVWIRVLARNGVQVECTPPVLPSSPEDNETASLSSSHSSANLESTNGQVTSKDSDVASSVASSFIDAMFRTPTKRFSRSNNKHSHDPVPPQREDPDLEPSNGYNVIACGMVVEVEPWLGPLKNQGGQSLYVRLRGGQGWIPLSVGGKNAAMPVSPPETRLGSFWFRVQSTGGIKVRLGPSKRAPSIKSENGVFFRFECGEYLRASEVVTICSEDGQPLESFAKLYRNRHLRLHGTEQQSKSLSSLTVQAEWVQVYGEDELFLEECTLEPRIERHRQGWRYTALSRGGVAVRRGPTFAAAKTGTVVLETETVTITERVRPAGERVTWLRMKDGSGWVHDLSEKDEPVMAPHTLTINYSKRVDYPCGAPIKRRPTDKREIAYSAIVARLFHGDGPEELSRPTNKDSKGMR